MRNLPKSGLLCQGNNHPKEGFIYRVQDHDMRGPWLGERLLRALSVREAGPARGRKRK